MTDKEKDIDYILEKELSIDRYCYIHNFIIDKNKEIERLNNIINELEKLINEYELGKYDYSIPVFILKDKLKELKESDKNDK